MFGMGPLRPVVRESQTFVRLQLFRGCYSLSMRNESSRGYCLSQNHDDMILLASRREGIYRIDPVGKEKVEKILGEGKFIYGIDFDYQDKKLFWTEREKHSIFEGTIDAEAKKVTSIRKLSALHGLVFPRNIAVDWLSKKLYIVETGARRIDISDYTGALRSVLIADGLTLPIDVALDPIEG